jgi:hypothetical protein
VTLILPEDFLVTEALHALDKSVPAGFGSMRLKVVGGFALQVRKIRTDPAEVTDLDYIGQPLPPSIKEIVNEVGLRFGLGPGWLNNDVLLSGSSDIEDIELSTGPLSFHRLDTAGLDHFSIEVADPMSLLRMKLVAIDTQLAAFLDSRNRADFTRGKDFADIHRICEHEGFSVGKLKEVVDEMSDGGYLIEPGATYRAAKQARTGRSGTQIIGDLL